MDEFTPQQLALAEAFSQRLGYGSFAKMHADFDGSRELVVDLVATVARVLPPLSWLSRGHRLLASCPGCGQAGLSTTGIDKIGYTYEVCECGTPEYPHMVEQLWHRTHMTGQPADQVVWTTRRATLEEVAADLAVAARKGDAGARGRTQLTYAGGLRAATRRVKALIQNMSDREQT